MFQLLQPIALWAVAGIVLPVLIHLWNIREGRTLKVGSISLLQESARQQAKSLKLTDLLLLLIRCLLIIAIALLIAKPVWQKQLFSSTEKGWVLIEKGGVGQAYEQHKKLIDSLRTKGYQFRYFNKGFATEDWQMALQGATDTTKESSKSYWTLLNRLNEQVPAELPVYVFTTNRLNRFAGHRPTVAMDLHWLTYSSTDTVYKEQIEAFKTTDGRTQLVIANSTPTATYYTTENRSRENVPATNNVDTPAFQVSIYTDQAGGDAAYVKAAIDAIGQSTGMNIKAALIKNENGISRKGDWLFWLSEKPLPKDHPPHVLRYEKGVEQTAPSLLYDNKKNELIREVVHFSRTVSGKTEDSAETIWADGFGNPLLTANKGIDTIYRFYSRFNPGWNDLPWSGNFVQALYDLLIHQNHGLARSDKRQIDPAQMQVTLQKGKAFDKQKFIETIDLQKSFWLLAFVLFSLERYISLIRNREAYA